MKIGIQAQSGIVQDFPKLLSKKPVAVLLLGNALGLDIAQQIRDLSPTTLILLRTPADNWALDRTWTQGFVARAMQGAMPYLQRGLCDFLLPPNEPVITNVPEAQLLNELQVEVAQDYHANGFQTGAYCFPVGNPPYSLWPYLQDGINACNGWLFLHEYGAPDLQTDAADLSLRHRTVSQSLLPAVANLKIGITECGIDLGIIGRGGGYRALPDNGHLIQDYVDNNLTWWSNELDKDPYVKFTTLFGYAMEHPWETFDVAAVDTDRAYFINWLQGGVTPPDGGDVITPAQLIGGIPFLAKKAINLDLGPSIYGEYTVKDDAGTLFHAWVFQRGGVYVRDGDYGSLDNAHLFNPVTGEDMATPFPWPCGATPVPPVNKRLTTADLPPEFGIVVNSYTPKAGEKFFGLVGAGNFKSGSSVGTQTTLVAVNEQGSPVIGYSLTHAYDQANQKSETFPSPTVGIILGAGSYYTPPQIGGDHFYVSKGAQTGVWPAKYPSDEVIAGMPSGQHFEATYTFQLMTG